MALSLYLITSKVTIQGIAFGVHDYFTYEPLTQVMAPYLDGDAVNPDPTSLPQALLDGLLAQGCLHLIPVPLSDNPGSDSV